MEGADGPAVGGGGEARVGGAGDALPDGVEHEGAVDEEVHEGGWRWRE